MKGSRAKGKTYERAVGRKLKKWDLGEVHSGDWFEYVDANGNGRAQPDHYIVGETATLLFECKLTQSDEAERQMEWLYGPLLMHYYELPVIMIQVCKNLRIEVPAEVWVKDWKQLWGLPPGKVFTWQLL